MSPVRADVVVVGSRLEPEHHRLRDLLTRTAQPHEWLEAGTPAADELLARHGAGPDDLPLVVDPDGAVRSATVERLAAAWRLTAPPSRDAYDLLVVGCGPAGLAAAVYAASDGLSTLVVERDVPGGQASHTSLVENFFGFPEGIAGADLARRAGRQAEKFGAELAFLQAVESSRDLDDGSFEATVAGGHVVRAGVGIAAPGMDWRRLEVDGVDELLGRGVYYGAGRSEAAHCGGEPVVVIGGGNSAGQAVMSLADAGAHVTLVVRGDGLAASMSAYLVDRIAEHPLIAVRLRTEVTAVRGDDSGGLAGVTLHERGGGSTDVPARALFVCIGGTPRTGWAADVGVAVDATGHLLTGPDLARTAASRDWPLERDPFPLETGVPGLFAAGDVRHGSPKRIAGAVGDGAMAVALAHRRLAELRG